MRVIAAALTTLAVLAPAARAGTATDAMKACAGLGPKHPGSAANRRMGNALADRFRAAGLQTRFERFHLPVWEPGPTSARIADGPGAGEPLPIETFAYSGTGQIEAPVVDLGSGGPADYDGLDVKGKIVLVNRSETYHRSVQIEQAQDHGAAAMLLVSASPDNLVQTGAVRWAMRPQAEIPAVTTGSADGAKLRAHMEQGPVTLRVIAQGARVDAVGRNVVGIRRGSTYPDRYVIVAGHYDSWYAGAFDNCTAVGSLSALIAPEENPAPAYTTIYAGWDAEEVGLVGSYSWIARHQDLIAKTVLDVNLEETASATFVDGEASQLPSVQLAATSSSPVLVGLLAGSAAATAFTPVVVPIFGLRNASGGIIPTDLEGFYGQGVQGFTTAGTSPYYHTTADTADKVNPNDLERVSEFLAEVVRNTQLVPPEGLQLREVPKVTVSAPKRARAGAAVPVDIEITDVTGAPVTGAAPMVLADQQDNWVVAESRAKEMGGGHYSSTLPAGATDTGRTRIRATISDTLSFANGFAFVDQRRGGLLIERTVCRKPSRTLHVRRGGFKRITARTTAGDVDLGKAGKRYTIRLNLRGTGRDAARLSVRVRTKRGAVVRQSRTFRTCA
jgi:predicted secreted protein